MANIFKGLWIMGRFWALAILILSSACGGHEFPPYSRVECLKDRQQMPVYRLESSYYFEDDPDTEKDESKELVTYIATAVVFQSGYLLTAGHAIEGAYDSIVIFTPTGPRRAERIALDPVNDLGLIATDTTGLVDAMPLFPGPFVLGQQVWVAGFPSDQGVSYSGSLIGLRGGWLELGAPVFQGMSGGPVIICNQGDPQIAGIISSYNYYQHREEEFQGEGGEKIIEKYYVNDGTSNAPGGMMLIWFTEFAIDMYEKNNNKREQE